jgi:hypothetical protein
LAVANAPSVVSFVKIAFPSFIVSSTTLKIGDYVIIRGCIQSGIEDIAVYASAAALGAIADTAIQDIDGTIAIQSVSEI